MQHIYPIKLVSDRNMLTIHCVLPNQTPLSKLLNVTWEELEVNSHYLYTPHPFILSLKSMYINPAIHKKGTLT